MRIHITGRQLKLTSPIQEYVEEKVRKAQKYFDNIIWAQVLLAVEKRTHKAEIVLHASKQTFRAMAKAGDLYAAVDLASDKMDAQLRKHKEKLRQRHKHTPSTAEVLAEEMDPRPVHFSVIKQVPLNPMSREEAAQDMDRMGYSFWMFQDRQTRQINVIFRRLDDTLGLLQPGGKGER